MYRQAYKIAAHDAVIYSPAVSVKIVSFLLRGFLSEYDRFPAEQR